MQMISAFLLSAQGVKESSHSSHSQSEKSNLWCDLQLKTRDKGAAALLKLIVCLGEKVAPHLSLFISINSELAPQFGLKFQRVHPSCLRQEWFEGILEQIWSDYSEISIITLWNSYIFILLCFPRPWLTVLAAGSRGTSNAVKLPEWIGTRWSVSQDSGGVVCVLWPWQTQGCLRGAVFGWGTPEADPK